jgi:hypothetical protein
VVLDIDDTLCATTTTPSRARGIGLLRGVGHQPAARHGLYSGGRPAITAAQTPQGSGESPRGARVAAERRSPAARAGSDPRCGSRHPCAA